MEMMQRRFFLPFFTLLICFQGFAQFKNIMLDQQIEGVYPPSGPSIAINPKNPKNIVAGAVLDKLYYTFDGGLTWTASKMTSKYGVYGDPVLVADSKGNFYYAHLADPSGKGSGSEDWLDRIVVQKSMNGGKKWDGGVSVGHNPPKQQDKPAMAIYQKTGTVFLTWTQFDSYGSEDPDCKSNIMLSQLKWGKGRWTKPIKINMFSGDCKDSDMTVEGAAPAVSADGRVYVAWSYDDKIYFDRSMDGGDFWLSNDLLIAEQPNGWDIKIPGVMRANGFPVVKVDNSRGPFRGVVHVMWSDQVNGENDTDIWIIKSGNAGDNWTQPVRVNNDDAGKHQFFPWMSIDPATGVVYILFYDRRAYDDNRTDVYLAYSTDGAQTFENVKISETPFISDEDVFFGDYTNLSVVNGTIAAIWTRMDEGKTSIWTTIIKDTDLIPALKKQKEEGKKKDKKK
jgi:hypothetical protein